MTRQMELIERDITIANEALAVFVRFWLTSTPALPNTALAAAQTVGRERDDGFVESTVGKIRGGACRLFLTRHPNVSLRTKRSCLIAPRNGICIPRATTLMDVATH